MQDIVFYAVASETGGMLRDYANVHTPKEPPALTLGVSVCLRMRLFASLDDTTPYPVDSFSGISSWQWSMGADFDRTTGCKLAADAESISVHTVTDTIKGETATYTEFVIPISNMNTEELAAWLGNAKRKTGLTGELIGCDNGGHAIFVLQIDDFSVRNRVSGLEDPTALDQEIVTRPVAEQMIHAEVSASAAAKQDKLTSANAGTGISVTSAGVISVANVPQSAITGLSASLAAKQDNITAGYRMALVSGSTVDQARYFAIEPAITAPANQTTTVVLSAGKAYEIHAVANNAKVLLTRENPVGGSRTFGLDGHAGIFVANTGYIQTGANVYLANALEPDAVNNCTVRFHDGLAIISVEDHVAGYIVVSATGTTAGTLPYALTSASQEYVAFDATLNGATIDLAGATANGEKHVVGNGYSETILSGGITCTSKTTFSNLSMDGVIISSGTLTMGDVNIPSGATVAVNGGGLAIEKAAGDGGTIDLGGTNVALAAKTVANVSGVVVTGGGGGAVPYGAAFNNTSATLHLSGCTVSGNTALSYGGGGGVYATFYCSTVIHDSLITGNVAGSGGGVMNTNSSAILTISGSTITDNTPDDILNRTGGTCTLEGGNVIGIINTSGGEVVFKGSNTVNVLSGLDATATVTISSGAIVDLTNNSNPTPINPGGGITFASGGATVLVGSGTASTSYMLDNVTLPAGAKLTNTASVDLGGSNVVISSGTTASASGCTFSGGSAIYGGAFLCSGALSLSGVKITGNTANQGCFTQLGFGAYLVMSGCSVYDNGTTNDAVRVITSDGQLELTDCFFGAGQDIYANTYSRTGITFSGSNTFLANIRKYSSAAADVIIGSGAILDLTGNTNATPIAPGGGITFASGGATVLVDSGGSVASSSYMMDNVTLPAGAKLTNAAAVNLGGTNITIRDSATASASGCTFTNGSAAYGGAFAVLNQAVLSLAACIFENNTASANAARAIFVNNATLVLSSGCAFRANQTIGVQNGASINIAGPIKIVATIAPNYTGTSGTVIISSGAIIDLTGNTNPTPIAPGGVITISSGGITIIDSGGTTHEFQRLAITGSTINSLGQIYGATVYVPASSGSLGPWNIYTTLGSSTVSAGEQAQEIVIDGGLVSIEEL